VRIANVAPGSDEWRQARIGIPTASGAHRIVTAGGKLSSQRDSYLCELAAERLLGTWLDTDAGDFAARGTALEPQAVAFYELLTNADTIPGGFCTTDDGRAGCSPDRLVLVDGKPLRGLEIKCPKPSTHVGYLLNQDHDAKYKTQVQYSLWVSGLQSWDIVSYHPGMPEALIRIPRNEPLIKIMSDRTAEFCDELDTAVAIIKARSEQPTGD
jgi:hypothetical protein